MAASTKRTIIYPFIPLYTLACKKHYKHGHERKYYGKPYQYAYKPCRLTAFRQIGLGKCVKYAEIKHIKYQSEQSEICGQRILFCSEEDRLAKFWYYPLRHLLNAVRKQCLFALHELYFRTALYSHAKAMPSTKTNATMHNINIRGDEDTSGKLSMSLK